MKRGPCRLLATHGALGWCVWLLCIVLTHPVHAVPVSVAYTDAAGEGFNDPALGMPRRAAIECAAQQWAERLGGSVPIVIEVSMDPLGGSGDSALLASTRAITLHRDFPGAPLPNTFYGAALANQLGGADMNGSEMAEIHTTFNSDVDGPVALGSLGWYYGLDGQPGADIDFVTIALHELGHGLGFFSQADAQSGEFFFGAPAIFDSYLLRRDVGAFPFLSPAQRRAAAVSGNVVWDGPYTVALHGEPPLMFAPNPFQDAASLSHWDPSLSGELMVPFYMGPVHDPGLLLPALLDMGWTLANGTPARPAAPPTATPTATAVSSPSAPAARQRRIYVSNFAADTVSVLDGTVLEVASTIPVGHGPIGLAASTDGRRLAIANFREGSITLLRTSDNTAQRTIPVGRSCNQIVVAPDGRTAYVTNTQEDSVSVVDLAAGEVVTVIAVGKQPVGIALTPDGTAALVAEFGANAVEAIDTRLNAVTAVASVSDAVSRGVLGIAVAANGERAAVSGVRIVYIQALDPFTLELDRRVFLGREYPRIDGVWVSPDASRALVIGTAPGATNGSLLLVALDTEEVLVSIAVGRQPAAIAGAADGGFVYVANAGSNTVSVVRARDGAPRKTIAVGEMPMGVAVAEVPQCPSDCDDDGTVVISELITAVQIAFGAQAINACPAADLNADGIVTVDEIVAAVRAAIGACGGA